MTKGSSDHLVPLGGGWTVWPWIRLRGTGFPARLVDELAMPEAARAVSAYLEAVRTAHRDREAAVEALSARFEISDRTERKALAKMLKRLRNPELPVPDDASTAAILRPLQDATARVRERWSEVRAAFEAGRRDCARATRRLLATDLFHEAVTWQNRHALAHGLRRLLEISIEEVDKDTRKREQAVASYLQRYCVKNDTISFFGPVSWGTVSDRPGIALTPGAALLASRTVYFEYWCIAALAQRLGDMPLLLPWLKPRRLPTVRIDDVIRDSGLDPTGGVASQLVAVLSACDGERPANQIADELVSRGELGFESEEDVFGFLGELVEQQLVLWTLEVPPEELYPDRYLREQLESITDEHARSTALSMLDALEAGRAAVARAAGNVEALDAALAAFEKAFTEITGREPTRKHGTTYGGRTLLYEDCRRDLRCEIGTDVLKRAAPSLELVLTSARWYTHTIARRYREVVRPIYERLRSQAGSAVVELAPFWSAIRPLLAGEGPEPSIVAAVTDELHDRWSRILELDVAARGQHRSATALAPLVTDQFRAPGPGWPLARYHSPDVMIAARGLEALSRGDYLVVVGEVHIGINSVFVPVFVKEFPDRELLAAARAADVPMPGIAPVWSHERSRADLFSMIPHDYALENGTTRSWRPRERVIADSSLVVESIDDVLYVRTRDGAVRFEIISFLEHHLVAASHSQFTLLRSAPHLPRVTVDNVVLSRERWNVAAADASFAHLATPLERFVGAQRWRNELGLPRRVFIKVPNETKPMYVDFESSLFVDNMASMVRAATSVTISEMLPSIDETWLVDREQQLYTSELRIVAVDPIGYTAND